MIYLDHNATTPVDPEVIAAVVEGCARAWGNPASGHAAGRAAALALEQARAEVAALVGAEPDEIVFTSGGTEADNLAVFGAPPGRVVTSTIEHPAVSEAVTRSERPVTRLAVGVDGVVELPASLPADTALVTLMLANNETGVLQPVRELAALARAVGARVHTDAAQAVGKIPVDVNALDVDLLTVAGHKLYAPKGVGALYVRRGTPLRPMLVGGGQQGGRRPGTEAVSQVMGLGAAARIAARRLAEDRARLEDLRDLLERELAARVPGVVVTGAGRPRLPNTTHVRFPGVTGASVLARAPTIAASTGSACHAGLDHPSPVLSAMGLSAADALGSVRLSLGRATTRAEVTNAAEQLSAAWREVRGG